MRLAWRVFLSTSLVMLVLIGIAGWSLRAVSRFVDVNAVLTDRTVPALRIETSLRDALPALIRIEGRWAVLQDPTYEGLWRERANRVARDLDALGGLLMTVEEERQLRKGRTSFAAYSARVQEAHADKAGARAAVPAVDTRRDIDRMQIALARLTDATQTNLARAQEEVRSLEVVTRKAIATALPLALVAGLVGAILVAYGMAGSLRRLSDASSDIARGSFPRPLAVRGGDDIARLTLAFNRMAQQLGEVDRMKEEFFAHISHELRTPLTAVREATLLLRDEIPGPLTPKQIRLVDIVRSSTERVLALVNRILELTRLQAGLLPYERRWVDLDKVVTRAVDELRPQAEARGLVLARNGTRPAGGVQGDEERLLQVLVNLVGNAIKYTPSGGRVGVHTHDRGDDVEVTIEDTGVGIAPAALPRVFDRYWQASGTRGGSGLGLAIVKSVVEAHGGTVHAESAPGTGSRFTIRLPRRGAPG
jgi:two-component system sensor histidine kinase GlrK